MRRRARQLRQRYINQVDFIARELQAKAGPDEWILVPDVHDRYLPSDRCGPRCWRGRKGYIEALAEEGMQA